MAEGRAAALALALLAIGGCAHYTPRPLGPPGSAAWEGARLDESRVLAALDSLGGAPAAGRWRATDLARAAWVLAPARARADAEIEAARAALRSAGVRPSPGVASASEYSFSGQDGSSRWGLALSGLLRLEFGGKRDARRIRAEAGVLSAIAAARTEAWQLEGRVLSEARLLASLRQSSRRLAGVLALQDSVLLLAEQRYAAGGLGEVERSRFRADVAGTRGELAALTRAIGDEQAALAAAVGVPLTTLEAIGPLAEGAGACPAPGARDSLLTRALQERWDLRGLLAGYQRAEADLRLEVARSWPDLELGPGLFFDHGVGKWTLGLGLPDLVLHGNRGPIGEAEAAREVAAARVREGEAVVLNEIEESLAGCRAAVAERDALDASAAAARLTALEAAWHRGEVGRLEVVLAAVEVARLAWREAELAGAESRAAGELEWRVGATAPSER